MSIAFISYSPCYASHASLKIILSKTTYCMHLLSKSCNLMHICTVPQFHCIHHQRNVYIYMEIFAVAQETTWIVCNICALLRKNIIFEKKDKCSYLSPYMMGISYTENSAQIVVSFPYVHIPTHVHVRTYVRYYCYFVKCM